ncbi:Hsp70 family protein [Streptomyces sp. MAR4 CNX-425]|uniref:Hsp70 family protein n=1 Tax=Streptomyces sp. MAR4 CNX-425 TaxID=3406343 RepID=UPI003B513F4A
MPGSTTFTPKIVAAIDFGTHGSGYAWAAVSALQDRANQRVIVYQPFTHSGGVTYPKDLTAVLVDANREPVAFGSRARQRWERELARGNPDNHGYASRFKMALQPGGADSGVPRFEGCLSGADRSTVVELITASLRHISQAALAQILKIDAQFPYAAEDIRWCVTIPAIWGDAERSLMRKAAKAAGLPDDRERLLLVQEPEAAAVHCALYTGQLLAPGHPEGRLDVEAEPGSRFMVVDCGGGTVDITSYRIRPEGVGPGRLDETRAADGDRLGSAYVNQAFTDLVLAERFGAEGLDKLLADFPREMSELEGTWESVKVNLAPETEGDGRPVVSEAVYVSVPGRVWDAVDPATRERLTDLADGETHTLVVGPGEVTRLFDSVVDEILAVIERQRALNRAEDPSPGREQMLLVGGFARSPYLRDAVAYRFGEEARIILPEDPAVAVLGGAVHFAYDPSVIWGRRSRYTYGFGVARPFREGIDPESKRWTDEYGEERCNNRFSIIARRGDSIPVGHKTTQTVMTYPSNTQSTHNLLVTYAAEPVYTDEEGVQEIGTVTADLAASQGRVEGRRYFDVTFSFGTTEIEVEARDTHSGATRRTGIEFHELYGRGSGAGHEGKR